MSTVIALSNLKVIFSFSGPAGGAALRRPRQGARLDQRWLRLALFLHSVLWTRVVYCKRGMGKIYRQRSTCSRCTFTNSSLQRETRMAE